MDTRDEYLLDQYFSRRITPAESTEMKERIASDGEFADTFSFEQKVAAATINRERQALKQQLQLSERQSSAATSKGWTVWVKYGMAAAAAIALLFFALPMLFNQPDQPAITFVPFTNEFATAGEQGASVLEQASRAYQAGEYSKAAELFGSITPQTDAYTFYQGVALTGDKQYDAAIEVLLPLARTGAAEYANPAHFYLALAYSQLGNTNAARAEAALYLATKARRGDEKMRAIAEEISKK